METRYPSYGREGGVIQVMGGSWGVSSLSLVLGGGRSCLGSVLSALISLGLVTDPAGSDLGGGEAGGRGRRKRCWSRNCMPVGAPADPFLKACTARRDTIRVCQVLGASAGVPGWSWGVLGVIRGYKHKFWKSVGDSRIWGGPEGVLGRPGSVLGLLRDVLGRLGWIFGRFASVLGRLRGFVLGSSVTVWGDPWSPT